jgi:hypothetical protein
MIKIDYIPVEPNFLFFLTKNGATDPKRADVTAKNKAEKTLGFSALTALKIV